MEEESCNMQWEKQHKAWKGNIRRPENKRKCGQNSAVFWGLLLDEVPVERDTDKNILTF